VCVARQRLKDSRELPKSRATKRWPRTSFVLGFGHSHKPAKASQIADFADAGLEFVLGQAFQTGWPEQTDRDWKTQTRCGKSGKSQTGDWEN